MNVKPELVSHLKRVHSGTSIISKLPPVFSKPSPAVSQLNILDMAQPPDRRIARRYKQQGGVGLQTKVANPITNSDSVSNKSASIDSTPLLEQRYLRNNSRTECLGQPRVVTRKYMLRNPKSDDLCQDQMKNTTCTFCKKQFAHVSSRICHERIHNIALSSISKYNSGRQIESNKLISPFKRVLPIRQTQKQKAVLNMTLLGEKKIKDVTKTIKNKQFEDSKTTKQSTYSLKPDLTCLKFGDFNHSMNKNKKRRYAKSIEQKQPTPLGNKRKCVCQYCKRTFSSHANCVRHVRLHTNDRPYGCTMCAEAFTNSTYLKRHAVKMHTHLPVVSNQKQCKIPKFHGDAGFGKRVTETNGMNRIESMASVTSDMKYNTDHMTEHPAHVENKIGVQTVVRNKRKSDNIPETIEKRGNVKTNASAVHKLMKAHKTMKISMVKCSSCHLCFSSQKYLNSHNASVHGKNHLICRFCKKRFTKVYNRVVHERLHTNEKPYGCTYCEDAFPNTKYLQRHVKKIHRDEIYIGWKKCSTKYGVNQIQGNVTTQQMQIEVVPKTITQFGLRSLEVQDTNNVEVLNHQVEHDTGKAMHKKCVGNEYQNSIKPKYSLKKNAFETNTNGQIGINLDSKSIPDAYKTKPVQPKNQAPLQTQTKRQTTACSKKCTNCHLAFTSQRKLNSHEVRVHGRDLFVCQFCQKRLSTVFARVTHEILHTNEKPYGCIVCDNAFPSNKHLQRHVMKYHKGDGRKMYTGKETVKYVMKASDKQQKISTIVQQSTKTKYSFKSAKQSKPLHRFSSELYDVNKKSPAGQKVGKNNTNKGVHIMTKCTTYKQASTSRIHNHPGVCSFCGKYFTRLQNCTAHEKYVHTGIKQNECLSCGALFRYPSTLQHHKKKCGATKTASKIKQEKINTVLDSETIVKLHRNTNTNRRNHLNYLENATMNELSLCKPQQPSGSKTVHNHPGVCSYCGKYYTRLDNCMAHEKYIHLGLKQYKCLSCSEYFGYALSLRKHRKKCHVTNTNTHKGKEEKSKVLDAKGFPNYIIHHTNHTEIESTDTKEQVPHNPQKPLSKVPQTQQGTCTFCGKYFTRKSNARIHERSVHLKLKPYKCFRCPVKFGWPDHLYKHVKQVHQGGAGSITFVGSENAESKTEYLIKKKEKQSGRRMSTVIPQSEMNTGSKQSMAAKNTLYDSSSFKTYAESNSGNISTGCPNNYETLDTNYTSYKHIGGLDSCTANQQNNDWTLALKYCHSQRQLATTDKITKEETTFVDKITIPQMITRSRQRKAGGEIGKIVQPHGGNTPVIRCPKINMYDIGKEATYGTATKVTLVNHINDFIGKHQSVDQLTSGQATQYNYDRIQAFARHQMKVNIQNISQPLDENSPGKSKRVSTNDDTGMQQIVGTANQYADTETYENVDVEQIKTETQHNVVPKPTNHSLDTDTSTAKEVMVYTGERSSRSRMVLRSRCKSKVDDVGTIETPVTMKDKVPVQNYKLCNTYENSASLTQITNLFSLKQVESAKVTKTSTEQVVNTHCDTKPMGDHKIFKENTCQPTTHVSTSTVSYKANMADEIPYQVVDTHKIDSNCQYTHAMMNFDKTLDSGKTDTTFQRVSNNIPDSDSTITAFQHLPNNKPYSDNTITTLQHLPNNGPDSHNIITTFQHLPNNRPDSHNTITTFQQLPNNRPDSHNTITTFQHLPNDILNSDNAITMRLQTPYKVPSKVGVVGEQTPKDENNPANQMPSTVENASMYLSWTCDMCKVAFGCQKALLYHKRCHDGVRIAGINEIKVPTKTLNYSAVYCTDTGLYKCNFCTAVFTQERQLKSHQFVHTRNKEHWYGCPQCGMKYQRHQDWMSHVMTHTKQEYLCKYCGKSFKVIKNWWNHEDVHEKEYAKQ